jgi:DNA-binding LacI/PurR family transcriptional regulator
VRVQHHKAGFEAAQLIVDLIEGAQSQPRHIILPVDLIVRGSARSVRETVEA